MRSLDKKGLVSLWAYPGTGRRAKGRAHGKGMRPLTWELLSFSSRQVTRTALGRMGDEAGVCRAAGQPFASH